MPFEPIIETTMSTRHVPGTKFEREVVTTTRTLFNRWAWTTERQRPKGGYLAWMWRAIRGRKVLVK